MPTKPKPLSERMEERILASWCRERGYAQHHIANEGKRTPVAMAELKAKGFASGFPDHLVCLPHAGLVAIELKRKGEAPTPEQMKWLADLAACGTPAVWCDSAKDAIEWLEKTEARARAARTAKLI